MDCAYCRHILTRSTDSTKYLIVKPALARRKTWGRNSPCQVFMFLVVGSIEKGMTSLPSATIQNQSSESNASTQRRVAILLHRTIFQRILCYCSWNHCMPKLAKPMVMIRRHKRQHKLALEGCSYLKPTQASCGLLTCRPKDHRLDTRRPNMCSNFFEHPARRGCR